MGSDAPSVADSVNIRVKSINDRIDDVLHMREMAITDSSHTAISAYTRQLSALYKERTEVLAGPAAAGPDDVADLTDDEVIERAALYLSRLPSPLLDRVLAKVHTTTGPGPFNRALRPTLEVLTGGRT